MFDRFTTGKRFHILSFRGDNRRIGATLDVVYRDNETMTLLLTDTEKDYSRERTRLISEWEILLGPWVSLFEEDTELNDDISTR